MSLLEGKCVLITGAAGGIGQAAAVRFAGEGAKVVLSDVSATALSETADLARSKSRDVAVVEADITDETSVRTLIEKSVGAFGRLDCAFNNAGVNSAQAGMFGKKLADWSTEAFDKLIAVNLRGTFLCMKYEILQMAQQARGAIVNTSSLAGLIGRSGSSGYGASKHGVVGLTKIASIEYASAGIRVNAVCPGVIETKMTRARMGSQSAATLSAIPLGRIGQPDEVVNLVAWLCSDQASYVTGVAYHVDGGMLAG